MWEDVCQYRAWLDQPILNGPPVAILLGFFMVLAGYLRQAYGASQEEMNKIELGMDLNDNSAPYPYDRTSHEESQRQLTFLRHLNVAFSIVTQLLFLLMAALVARILFWAWLPVKECGGFLNRYDTGVSVFIVIIILGAWLSHTVGTLRRRCLRRAAIRAR